jgi:intracellular septation protein
MNPQTRSLVFGGLLPIVAFTLIDSYGGPLWGTIAGMTFGIGEIIYEKVSLKKVSNITWISNLMILGLGVISILSDDGVWFKLQPALLEGFFALFLWASLFFKKNLLAMMAEKQMPQVPELLEKRLKGLTLRLGFFFAGHALLATWAAISWSTLAWAALKGVGFMGSAVIYMLIEVLFLRRSVLLEQKKSPDKVSRD